MAVGLADVVNGADVGMIQRGCCPGLSLEALTPLRVVGEVIGQKFQGDKATEAGILGLVDDTHAAGAELLQDAIVRDDLSLIGIAPGHDEILENAAKRGYWQ
jgi:hypothetical protein